METPDPSDELFHPVGDHEDWSESYYFNFYDPTCEVGCFTRMGFRPNAGWADALHAVFLPGGRVAFTYGTRSDLTPRVLEALGETDPAVGHLLLRRARPFREWRIVYAGSAEVTDDPSTMLLPRAARPAGWAEELDLVMEVSFRSDTDPYYARRGEHGHFEQTGIAAGQIRLGDERWTVEGLGVRDKSWGPRTWQAPSGSAAKKAEARSGVETTEGLFLNWFSVNLGPKVALGGACGRNEDGEFEGKGWIQRNGRTVALELVTMATELDETEPLMHRSVTIEAIDADGEAIEVEGEVLTVCPTKIPRSSGMTFVNEGLTRFTMGDLEGHGITEHWHFVPR